MDTPTGSQLVTADAAVGTSGSAVQIYAIHIISGGTAAVVSLRSGTSAGNTAWITETGAVSTGKTFTYGNNGFTFPSGCFVDVDGNTTSVLVSYKQ